MPICNICGTNIKCLQNLNRHIKSFHPSNNHEIYDNRQEANVSRESINAHIVNENIELCCKYCDSKFKIKKLYQNHMKKYHNENISFPDKIFTCDICYDTFTRNFSLKKHKERKHSHYGAICRIETGSEQSEETDLLSKVASLNSPARLTCIISGPKDNYEYQWKVNHKGKGSAAYSGCKLDPALHGPRDLKRKDSHTSGYSKESITTFKPLSRKKRKIWIDKSDIRKGIRTEKSDINNGVNDGVRTEDLLKAENEMYNENIYDTIPSDTDENINVDYAVKNEIRMVEVKEESLVEETQDLVEATDQCTDPLNASTSVPEPNTKGPEFLGSQERNLQHTNMVGTLIVPFLNCSDIMVQAQSGQEMQAAGQNAQMMKPQMQASGLTAQTYNCRICKILFINGYLFVKHIKEQNHPTCTICLKYFKTDQILTKHVRDYHYRNMSDDVKPDAIAKTGVSEVVKLSSNIKCINDSCMVNDTSFTTLKKLREHMQHVHNEDHPHVTHTFDTFEDFKTWKDEEEGRTGTNYTKKNGNVSRKKGTVTKMIFNCKRSGTYTAQGQGKRLLKSKGSVKMGSYCTSTMVVEEYNNTKKISIKYYSKHSGHDMDISNLMHNNLCQIDKEKIADKLRQGVPISRILEEVRETANNDRGKHISRQDIHNVALVFGLPNKDLF